MDYQTEYQRWIDFHIKKRAGERRRRLKEGMGHAETTFLESVWWPSYRNFEYLHPQYEIRDFRDGYRYIDFAYIRGELRLAIEIDGFGPHWRNINKWAFTDHLRRQNELVIDGWTVLRFSYDDTNEQSRHCQQTIQQLIGRWAGRPDVESETSAAERDVIRLLTRSTQPLRPTDVSAHLNMSTKSARRLLHRLTESGWLQPVSGKARIRSYRIHPYRSEVRL